MVKSLSYKIKREFIRLKTKIKYRKNKNLQRKIYDRIRDALIQKIIDLKIKKEKFCVSYSVFDGYELLRKSIESIRESADYINVVYQKVSWYGTPADEKLLPALNELKQSGLIDELIEFSPDFKRRAGENERIKRNLGLKYVKKAGGTYFMTMDTDEFFIREEVEAAKRKLIENEITHSYCPIVVYGLKPTERLLSPCSLSVQFFSKIKRKSYLGKNNRAIALVDPTRCLSDFSNAKYYYFPGCEMHHMKYIRKDVDAKMKCSSNTHANKISRKMIEKRLGGIPKAIEPNRFNVPDFL